MKPRLVTDDDLASWPQPAARMTFLPPKGNYPSDCERLDAVVGPDHDGHGVVIHIPWTPDELEVADLAHGGTLWLSIFADYMPPVALIVDGPSGQGREPDPGGAP